MFPRILIAAAALSVAATTASAQGVIQRWPSERTEPAPPPQPPTAAQAPAPAPPPERRAEPRRQPPPEEQREAVPRPRRESREAPPPPRPPVVERRGGTNIYIAPRYNNYPPRYYSYPRRYYPYGYGAFGLGYFYYDPYGWYPRAPLYSYGGGYYGHGYGYDMGEVRLRVRPRDAQVFVDGYYAGTVDDYDGTFQALRLESGPYHIELRLPGYETLEFDVRVTPGQRIDYRGDLRRLP